MSREKYYFIIFTEISQTTFQCNLCWTITIASGTVVVSLKVNGSFATDLTTEAHSNVSQNLDTFNNLSVN